MDPLTIGLMLAKQFAPDIIKHFTNSETAGAVADKVIDIAKTVTGSDSGESALAALQADPTLAMKFQTDVMNNETEVIKAYIGDVQNARAMQVAALNQEDLFSKRFVYYFAAAWSLFSMIYFVCVTFIPIPPAGQRIADTILGVLIASVIGVMFSYFYGTTKNSKAKDDTISKLSKQ
jgi:hypothetical protein